MCRMKCEARLVVLGPRVSPRPPERRQPGLPRGRGDPRPARATARALPEHAGLPRAGPTRLAESGTGRSASISPGSRLPRKKEDAQPGRLPGQVRRRPRRSRPRKRSRAGSRRPPCGSSFPSSPIPKGPVGVGGDSGSRATAPSPPRAGAKLVSEELLITQLAGSRLKMELDEFNLWRGGNHVKLRQVWQDFASYLYLSRLRDGTSFSKRSKTA